MLRFFETIGGAFIKFLEETGRVVFLFIHTVIFIFRPPLNIKNVLIQIEKVGVNSIPVVIITGAFTGMVLALQSHTGFKRFGAETFVGTVVALSITRELGPVLSGLMVSGRVGAAMAAELGTMRVTEQIDAMSTLAVNPVKYLIVPRFLAAVIVMPILVIFSDIIGITGGYIVSVFIIGSNSTIYASRTWDFLHMSDVICGIIKAVFFGMIFSIISCSQGFKAEGGASGVGNATTNSVVISSLFILISNYIITALLF